MIGDLLQKRERKTERETEREVWRERENKVSDEGGCSYL
jgi:hypothetical protein